MIKLSTKLPESEYIAIMNEKLHVPPTAKSVDEPGRDLPLEIIARKLAQLKARKKRMDRIGHIFSVHVAIDFPQGTLSHRRVKNFSHSLEKRLRRSSSNGKTEKILAPVEGKLFRKGGKSFAENFHFAG